MKTIILVSSIFYLLGLKISHQIDVVKKTCPIEKTVAVEMADKKSQETICAHPDLENCAVIDSTLIIRTYKTSKNN